MSLTLTIRRFLYRVAALENMAVLPEEWENGKIDVFLRWKHVIKKFFNEEDDQNGYTADQLHNEFGQAANDFVYEYGRSPSGNTLEDLQHVLGELDGKAIESKPIVLEEDLKQTFYRARKD